MTAKKIMIIEDDKDILEILEHILSGQDYQVFAFSTGQQIDKIREITPDLILCDNWLPGTRGTELCKQLKASDLANIPFILISTSMSLTEEAIDCGADSYIQKPFNIKEVISIVATYL
ncbi:response regulator [Pedobacter sp. HMF7647]|uniref:Response regulator n=1 Tax=Hufsiella arboris TaxID=2695275 RepID=A0A7K1YDA8_9SPHI|nr:response regulator transcription factor [Hufsiella arboris]MXV52574.1 response regulator [Hufsiella arboris]